tara:strand:- start:228 stop:710 length:483 start_codon:yes stop_codon:yes gene_type:complete
MQSVNIRKGKKEDLPDILQLIHDLAKYEKSLDQVEVTIDQLENDGFGTRPWFWFLVAEIDCKIVGMAFYFIRYSTWKGKFLFLEDFVIKDKYRGQGMGASLFEATIQVCKDLELNGMSWQVLDWNEPAINFYNKYNAQLSNSWLDGKFSKNQIMDFDFSK